MLNYNSNIRKSDLISLKILFNDYLTKQNSDQFCLEKIRFAFSTPPPTKNFKTFHKMAVEDNLK